jgi:hypothetical protein
MKITIEGKEPLLRWVATALQLALYTAGFEVYYEHGPGDRTSFDEGDSAGNLLATTFDNIGAFHRKATRGKTKPEVTIRVKEMKLKKSS